MCAAHLFLLHVLVIIRITHDVYCANLKAKLQFMFILILNDWTLPVWISVYRKCWLTIAINLFSSWRVQLLKLIMIPDNRLFFSTSRILKHATPLKPLLTHHLWRSDISLKLCEKFEFQRLHLEIKWVKFLINVNRKWSNFEAGDLLWLYFKKNFLCKCIWLIRALLQLIVQEWQEPV